MNNYTIKIIQYKNTLDTVLDEPPLWKERVKNIFLITKHEIKDLENIQLIQKHKNIIVEKIEAIYPEQNHPAFMNKIWCGCTLSHIKAIKIAKERNYDNVMILEDDVVLHKHFNKYLNIIIEEMKTIEWDVLHLHKDGSFNTSGKIYKKYNTINQIDGFHGTECYIINKTAYDIVINSYDNILKSNTRTDKNNIDNWYKNNNQLKKYAPYLNLSSQLKPPNLPEIPNLKQIIEPIINNNIAFIKNKNNFNNKTFQFCWNTTGIFNPKIEYIIKLEPNGKISGKQHYNETYWDIIKGQLCFLNGNKKITTTFNNKKDDILFGKFNDNSNTTIFIKEIPEIKNWSGKKLDLKDTTLICIDCVDAKRAIKAIEISKTYANFTNIKFLTSCDELYEHIVKIPNIKSTEKYSEFCIKELYKYIDTKYMLIIQHDGHILNPDSWNNEWYNCDYIGGNVGWKNGGNGGFSFRTKKLMEFVANNIKDIPTHSEDGVICKLERMGNVLIKNGFIFKQDKMFGNDNDIWSGQFGHHRNNLSMWKLPIKDFEFEYNLLHYEKNLQLNIDDSPKWNDYFKNILVISKYDINSQELKNVKLIQDHKNIKIQKFEAIYPSEKHPAFPEKAHYGCALSHYNVIKMAKQNNWNNVMILEDDVIFHKQFNYYMNQIVEELKTIEWDLFYGFKNNPNREKVEIIKEYKTINQTKGILSGHCYVVNKIIYDYILFLYEEAFNKKTSTSNENTLDRFLYSNSKINKFIPKLNLASPILRNQNMSHIDVPYTKELLNPNYKIVFNQLESPIINVCNLSCEHCVTTSPYHKTNLYPIDKFENDIKTLSKYYHVKLFHLLGGEPFLLQNLEQYVDILRNYNFCDEISIITNGLLLPTYKNKDIFNKIDILTISYYSDVNAKNIIEKWLSENKIKCKVDKRFFKDFKTLISYKKFNNLDTQKYYNNCTFKKCHTIYNGKYYMCEESIFNQKLLKINGNNEDLDDGIDISSITSPIDFEYKFNILKSKPLKNCAYCYGSCGCNHAHKQIKVEKIF